MTDVAHADDRRLAERIQQGDREALGELYDRYAAIALRTALRIVRDTATAEDMVHDAFVAAWRRIDSFDPERGVVRSWLLTIVRNRCLDRLRAQRPEIDVDDADSQSLLRTDADPTSDGAFDRVASGELRDAIATLVPDQRRAVELAYFGGYTYREIAALTGVPDGTASGRLRLALAKLRVALRRGDDGLTRGGA
jgi:RNA polymerase sigma-70 factor (ECF subfamily)